MTRRWWLRVGLFLVIAAGVWLCLEPDSLARVGGGQSYGGGRSSSGRSSGGSSGGDLDLGIILLLIQLVVEYPLLGIPLLIGGGLVWWFSRTGSPVRARNASPDRVVAGANRAVPGLQDLAGRDPDFSVPVFLDFAVLLHRRALEAIESRGEDDALAPFVDPKVLTLLRSRKVSAVSEVVCGAVRILKIEHGTTEDRLFVRLESTRVESGPRGPRRFTIEDWLSFRRSAEARSLPPEKMESLSCPSCGAPIEVTPLGACTQCGSAITKGQLQWQLVWFEERDRTEVTAPDLALSPGGDEPGVRLPIVVSTGLAQGLARIEGFDQALFQARVRTAYLALQEAWTANRWQTSRPYVTDRMFQTLRFWMDQYDDAGLNNVLEEVELLEARPVDAQTDRWFHAVTVRIVGRMKDSTVDEKGRLVGGNPDQPRRFAEYWTFLRSVDPAPSKGATDTQCPSCGAPLDRVDETGICGYCSSKITSGRFDWVLSRIEQPQAYR